MPVFRFYLSARPSCSERAWAVAGKQKVFSHALSLFLLAHAHRRHPRRRHRGPHGGLRAAAARPRRDRLRGCPTSRRHDPLRARPRRRRCAWQRHARRRCARRLYHRARPQLAAPRRRGPRPRHRRAGPARRRGARRRRRPAPLRRARRPARGAARLAARGPHHAAPVVARQAAPPRRALHPPARRAQPERGRLRTPSPGPRSARLRRRSVRGRHLCGRPAPPLAAPRLPPALRDGAAARLARARAPGQADTPRTRRRRTRRRRARRRRARHCRAARDAGHLLLSRRPADAHRRLRWRPRERPLASLRLSWPSTRRATRRTPPPATARRAAGA